MNIIVAICSTLFVAILGELAEKEVAIFGKICMMQSA